MSPISLGLSDFFYRRTPGNGESDASIAFWLRKGHSAAKPFPQLAIREDATFFVQNCTKKLFFATKDTKTNFDASMILQKPALLLKGNVFLNGQSEGGIIFCHLNSFFRLPYSLELLQFGAIVARLPFSPRGNHELHSKFAQCHPSKTRTVRMILR